MLRPGPSSMALMASALAPAALSRLQTLGKYLENGNSAFSVEVVHSLEDTIADIKKLEEIRRHTLECLEEETIKNSNLRFRLKKIPGELIAEMRALVTAAREASAARINQLQSALRNIADEIELLAGKKTLCERQNAALCEEQEHLWKQQKEKEDLLNERIARKANTNLLLTETCDKTRAIELEIIRERAALEELKDKIAKKMSKLEKEEKEWDEKTREMKKILDAQEAKNSEKKREFENLNKKYLDIQNLINLTSTAISNEEILIAQLKEKSNVLEETSDSKNTGMLEVTEEKIELDSEVLLLHSEIVQEKEDFSKELGKAEEDLHIAECLNKKLKLENKAMRQKYEEALEEEQHWARKRNKVLAKRRDFSVLLDAKLQSKEKALKENENLEKEIEKLEERLENMKQAYEDSLRALEQDLVTQKKTRVMLRWKLLISAQQRKSFLSEVESINRKINERIEADKQRHADLLLKIQDLQKEIFESENRIKALTEEARKKKNEYRKYNVDFTNKLNHLESDLKTAMEILLKKEEELNTSKLTLEEIQRETEEKHTKYEGLRKSYLEKKNEELKVKRDIQQSVNTTEKLKKDMLELRKELRIKRDAVAGQLKTHTESLKLLERDIYEINRKLDIVNSENFRLRLCNVQMKEDIFAINSEAEHHKAAIVRLRKDGAVLRDLLLKGWSEDSLIQKEILENKQEMLTAVVALKTNIQQQEEKIGGICSRLQNELQGLDALFAKKSRLDNCSARLKHQEE